MRTVRDDPRWPGAFELDVGERYEFARGGTWTVALDGIAHEHQPDEFIERGGETIAGARVEVTVDGEPATLRARPFAWPTTVGGLRLFVETTARWATAGEIADVEDVRHAVRLSAVPAGEPWGPRDVAFPVGDYRWRANSYNNTWSALVPYNRRYYHRGEDYGAVPDRLPVRSPVTGTVTRSPLPDGDGASNAIVVDGPGIDVRLAHANVETVAVETGDRVDAGEPVARTGCTWDGRRSQTHDPHLHVGFHAAGTTLNPYPTLVEAYFRDYPDAVVAVAGGYYFVRPGDPVTLDGSRSLAHPGREIDGHEWHLDDGRRVERARTTVRYDDPGLYAEELRVATDDGHTARDYAQIRVWPDGDGDGDGDGNEQPAAYGWVYHSPVRGLAPGDAVGFRNRLRYEGPVEVSFGDGATTTLDGDADCTHVYDAPGTYTVTFAGADPDHEPVTAKLRVVVGGADG